MTRYAWPHDTRLIDDGLGRRRFNERFFPPPRFGVPDGSLPPVGDPPPDPPPSDTNLWLPIGPSVVLGGQASGGPRIAGRVRELAVEPTRGGRLYAATGSGGVWFSASRGVTWEPLDDFGASPNRNTQTPVGNSLSCGAIHVEWGAADDGTDDVVTVGTGEIGNDGGIGRPGAGLAGVGVLRAKGPATGTVWDREAIGSPAGSPDLRGGGFFRIIHDPADPSLLLAATANGLITRTEPSTPPTTPTSPWSSAAFATRRIVDVAVTRHRGPDRVRVWVAEYSKLHVAESQLPAGAPKIDPSTLAFTEVDLPDVHASTRLALTVGANQDDLWVLGRRTPVGDSTFEGAHLWHVDAAMDITAPAPTATSVPGLPLALFGSKDQSYYDIAVAAHLTTDDRLWVGGSGETIDGTWNAALHRVAVTRAAGDFTATTTQIGSGVHADVHAIRISPSPGPSSASVWVGCDGGVFLSDRDGDPDSFVARNTGMATLEPGFVASHPTNDGIVMAGMQDNGVCVRSGDSVWLQPHKGDGGGVAFDPVDPTRTINQYLKAKWRATSAKPVHRRSLLGNDGGVKNSQDFENDQSEFYSGVDAVAHGGTTHLALGTNRVWYSDDWGRSWVTLPTGTDPRAELAADLDQDVLSAFSGSAPTTVTDRERSFLCCTDSEERSSSGGSSVLTVKWGVRATSEGRVRVRLAALVEGGSTAGVALIEGDRATDSDGSWSWNPAHKILPIRAPDPAVATERAGVVSGDPIPFLPAVGLVNDVAVHNPDRGPDGSFYVATIGGFRYGTVIDTLWWYDGTSSFVPVGLRRNEPRGTWPSVAMPAQDRRITAPCHAVIVDPDTPDDVYVGTSVGVVKGTLSFDASGQPQWSWDRFDNNLPEAVVHDLSIHDHDGQRLLRAALASRGVWELDLAASNRADPSVGPRSYLRLFPSDSRRRLPTPLSGPTTAGEARDLRWDNCPDIAIDQTSSIYPGGPLEPTLREIPQPRFGNGVTAVADDTSMRIHVLVHHRWHTPAQPSEMRVALMRHSIDDGGVALGGLWPVLVALSAGGPIPTALPDGWSPAGSSLVAEIAAPVSARTPRAATFDVDLASVAGQATLIFAVVIADDDPLRSDDIRIDGTDATTVEELVIRSRHAGARSIRAG